VTWDRRTGKPLHNFICWYDLRSADLCKQWNDSVLLKVTFETKAEHPKWQLMEFIETTLSYKLCRPILVIEPVVANQSTLYLFPYYVQASRHTDYLNIMSQGYMDKT
jgi:hypothetical protein